MGKGDRKTKARQSRRKFEAMAGVALAPTPKSKKRGKARMQEIAMTDTSEKREALAARARSVGIAMRPETAEDGTTIAAAARWNAKVLKTMDHVAMGTPAGRAIFLSAKGDEARKLLDTFTKLTIAEERYHRVVLGVSMHAKTGWMEMLTERVETSADHDAPDLRDEGEKARAASNAWARWRGYLGHLDAGRQTDIIAVVRGRREPHDGQRVTPAGRRFISALRDLIEVVDKAG